jgi:hypothetical protein
MSTVVNAFRFQSFALSNTRAPHLDTDYVAVAISQNGVFKSVQAKRIGNVNNGTHVVNLVANLPAQYAYTDELVFSYMVINHGGGSTQDVINDCTAAMTQIGWNTFNASDAAVVPVGNRQLPACLSQALRGVNMKIWWNQMKPAFQHLDSNRCDGPVVIDSLSFTGASMTQIQLAENQQHPFSFIYLGIDSAVGCGSNSHYSAQWFADVEVIQP